MVVEVTAEVVIAVEEVVGEAIVEVVIVVVEVAVEEAVVEVIVEEEVVDALEDEKEGKWGGQEEEEVLDKTFDLKGDYGVEEEEEDSKGVVLKEKDWWAMEVVLEVVFVERLVGCVNLVVFADPLEDVLAGPHMEVVVVTVVAVASMVVLELLVGRAAVVVGLGRRRVKTRMCRCGLHEGHNA